MDRGLKILNWSCSLAPFLGLIVFYTLAVVIYSKVGHLPWFNNPDPKELVINYWCEVTNIFLAISFIFSFVFIVICLVFYFDKTPVSKVQLVLFIIGILIWIIVLKYDPFMLFDWYFD